MKKLLMEITVAVEVHVPDDFPVPNKRVEDVTGWKANYYSDGRHDFSTEMVFDGIERLATKGVHEAVFEHVCDTLPSRGQRTPLELDHRNALIARITQEVRCHLVEGGYLTVTVKDAPEKSDEEV